MEQDPKKQPPRRRPQNGQRSAGYTTDGAARSAMRRRAARKKRIRRNRTIAGAILVLLIGLVVGLIVWILVRASKEDDALPGTSVGQQESTPEASLPVEAPQEPVENPANFNYYEAGIPLLLNRNNPVPDGYEDTLELVEIGVRPDTGEMHSLEKRVAAAYFDMVAAAEADGITLYPMSGYRSNERQISNYNNSVSNHMANGNSREEAERLTEELYAVPGTSEHEAGLAVDINSLDTTFEGTEAFAWLQQHCGEYGFILRYEKDTEEETGISYEPWHYRYVGDNHAKAIQQKGVTLEAYVAELEAKG